MSLAGAHANLDAAKPPPPANTGAGQQDANTSQPIEVQASRGQLLYENHCMGCHDSVAHVRENRRVDSPRALDKWVMRWADQLKLPWNEQDIRDVSEYLEKSFYKFNAASPRKK
jgi:mono/diheme cytochrome c family protein